MAINKENVESLRYKGTSECPDIKIFVSHRIDQDSEVIDNPLYVPVRCGAVYDNRENVTMLGDDTGDNISEKRMSFNEFTVMYWAWKNVEADYYGLCHYRRFLSFADEDFAGPMHKMGYFNALTPASMEKIGILDEQKMRSVIENSDIITSKEYDIIRDSTPLERSRLTAFQWWLKYAPAYLSQHEFDALFEIIKEKFPKYYDSAMEYRSDRSFRGYNCFIMKKEAFESLCEFVFGVLFEFEKKVDTTNLSETQLRFAGYAGEWLYSIWMHHHEKQKKWKVESRQLVGFANTSVYKPLSPAFLGNNIPVVIPLTDSNAPNVGVLIQSIIDTSSPAKNYDIILLHRTLDSGDTYGNMLRCGEKSQILSLAKQHENISIRFYEPQFELENISAQEWGKGRKTESDYYPFLLPWILERYQKAVFLESNAFIRADVSELYEVNLGQNCIAGARSLLFNAWLNGYEGYGKDFKGSVEKNLKLRNPYNYIWTNVLLFDFVQIRATFKKAHITDFLNGNSFNPFVEDGINVLYDEKIMCLPQKWNHMERNDIESVRACGLWDFVPTELQTQWKEKDVRISFSRNPSPLQTELSQCFFETARRTPFYEHFILSTSFYAMDTINKFKNRFPRNTRLWKIIRRIVKGK